MERHWKTAQSWSTKPDRVPTAEAVDPMVTIEVVATVIIEVADPEEEDSGDIRLPAIFTRK